MRPTLAVLPGTSENERSRHFIAHVDFGLADIQAIDK